MQVRRPCPLVRVLPAGFFLWAALAGAGGAGAQTVEVWLTTADQQKKLQPQAPVAFAPAAAAANPVVVDEAQVYQEIEGFGASFTDSSAYLLNQVAPPAARTAAMANLFTRDGDGIGLSFVRNPMGACDYSRWHYSYDDQPAGAVDPSLTGFSIQHDLADIIPLVQQARQLNPRLTIMANPWSPPGWMKTSDSLLKGTLRTDMYAAFASYFVKYIQACAANGIPIHYVSLQNEPMYQPDDYPGMGMDAATQVTVLRDYVLPAFTASQLATQVLVYDHNWDGADYPDQVLADPVLQASGRIAGTAWHGYGGTPGAMTTLANKYPAKGNYQTEHSGGTWIANQLKSDFAEITQAMRSWSRAYVKWNLALDQNRGPHTGGGSTSTPLITINSATGAVSYTIEYYTLGHFSKFVRPGARRVYSTNGAGVVSAAFVNPDASKVLVAFNDTAADQTFQVAWGNRQFGYTLPASAGATFTWAGTQAGGYTVDATRPVQASSFNSTLGLQTETTTDVLGGYDVGYSANGKYAVYQKVDFGAGVASVNVRVASATNGGTLEFRLDGPTGPRIAALAVTGTGGWQVWQTVTGSVAGASGVHDLYLVCADGTGGSSIANVNWFQFSTASVPVAPGIATVSPSGQTVAAGHSVSFFAAATGFPAVAYQWQISSNSGSSWSNLANDATYSGTATNTLTVTGASAGLSGSQYRVVASNSAGAATSGVFTLTVEPAIFPGPIGLVADPAGNLWVSDNSANTIQKVSAGTASLLAGASGQQGSADGVGAAALFRQPGGIAIDAAGNLYVADTGNSLIRKITSGGAVTTAAGSATNQGYRDGTGTDAWFNVPAGLAIDGMGNLYVADTGNSVIRRISPAGVVTTVAGTAGLRGSADGTGLAARFNQPAGVAIDSAGTLYIADTLNQTIRKILSTGTVSTWVGLTGVSGIGDGTGSNALFNQPAGLCFDGAGNLYVADAGNAAIRLVTPAGVVSTLAGLSSVAGHLDGTGSGAWFNLPKDVKYDGGGNLYVADSGNAAIRKVALNGAVSTLVIAPPSGGGGGSGGSGSSGGTGPVPSSGGGGGALGPACLFAFAGLALLRHWRTKSREIFREKTPE